MASGLMALARQLDQQMKEAQVIRVPDDAFEAIEYEPRPLQAALDLQDRRFNVRVLHRRFGKTVREVAKLVDRAVECPFPDGRYAYFAPTYAQAEDIAWLYLERFHGLFCEKAGVSAKEHRHRGKLFVSLPTRAGGWARIRLYGLDTPRQRVRGLYLDGAVFDEFAWIPWSAWTEQVRPMLMDDVRSGLDRLGRRNQWADFIFTPAGRNHAYSLFRKAQAWSRGEAVVEVGEEGEEIQTTSDEWDAALYCASETGIITEEELKNAYREMGRSKYMQEMECSFDAAIEGAIFAEEIEALRDRGRITHVPVDPLSPVNTAWDLGYDDATAVWFFQQRGEEVRIVDFIEVQGAGLPRIVEKLAERDYRYGYHLLPWDVEVSELGTGKTRASVLRELGVRVTVVPRVKVKSDMIAAAQAILPLCAFDQNRCAEGLDRLALYRREYDERRGVMREAPLHDWASHAADAFGSLALGIRKSHYGRPDASNTTRAVL